jgi:hypothetical protein
MCNAGLAFAFVLVLVVLLEESNQNTVVLDNLQTLEDLLSMIEDHDLLSNFA